MVLETWNHVPPSKCHPQILPTNNQNQAVGLSIILEHPPTVCGKSVIDDINLELCRFCCWAPTNFWTKLFLKGTTTNHHNLVRLNIVWTLFNWKQENIYEFSEKQVVGCPKKTLLSQQILGWPTNNLELLLGGQTRFSVVL